MRAIRIIFEHIFSRGTGFCWLRISGTMFKVPFYVRERAYLLYATQRAGNLKVTLLRLNNLTADSEFFDDISICTRVWG